MGSGQGSGSSHTRLQNRPRCSNLLSRGMPYRITLTVRPGYCGEWAPALMTMAVVSSPFNVGSTASANRPELHHARTHLSNGAKQRLTSSSVLQGRARSPPSYNHSLRYCRRLFQLPRMERADATAFWRLPHHRHCTPLRLSQRRHRGQHQRLPACRHQRPHRWNPPTPPDQPQLRRRNPCPPRTPAAVAPATPRTGIGQWAQRQSACFYWRLRWL